MTSGAQTELPAGARARQRRWLCRRVSYPLELHALAAAYRTGLLRLHVSALPHDTLGNKLGDPRRVVADLPQHLLRILPDQRCWTA